MSRSTRVLSLLAKIGIFLLAFLIVLWVQLGFKLHFTDYIRYLFFTNDWGTIIIIVVVGFIVAKVLEFLLTWVFHHFFARRHA